MHNLIRPTIYFNDLPWYNPKSILTHLEKPTEPIIDREKTAQAFRLHSKNIYKPVLSFLWENRLEANLVVTASFVKQSAKHYPQNLDLIKKLIEQDLVLITADCYNGESFSCFYNTGWWSRHLLLSINSIQHNLGVKPYFAFVSQIFRSLEVERIVFEAGINNFIIRQKGSKLSPFRLKLSELRRFNGQPVSWINQENDQTCNFIALPDSQFYEPNSLIFLPNLSEQVKRLSMEIGLGSSLSKLKKIPGSSKQKTNFRLAEQPSLALFNDLERSVLRMWEYVTTLILSRLDYHKEELEYQELYKIYSRIQNKDFFYYLNKNSYFEGASFNFTSPYEAFATMQTIAKKLEIYLDNL